MKILLLNPPSKDLGLNRDMAGGLGFSAGKGVVLPPLDLLGMGTTLLNKGHGVAFVDAIAEKTGENDILKMAVNYDVVIGLLSLPTLDEDCQFYRKLKSLGVRVFIKTGINYPNLIEKIKKQSLADEVIFREADLDIEDYLLGKKVNSEPLVDLDKLPIPKRELGKIGKYKYVLLPGVVTTMQTSRGCPFPCGYYCPYPLVQGKNWRAMTATRVIREIEEIKKLKINNILFRDATFTLDMKRTEEICRLIIKKKIKIRWWCETRINVLSKDLLEWMKKAGCVGINVGIETMDNELIVTEGKPGVTVDDVIEMRKASKRIGIRLHFLMIMGLPHESVASIKRTFDYLVKLRPETIGVTSITPYPGTKMFEEVKAKGLIESFDWNRFDGVKSNMRTMYLSVAEIELGRKLLMATAFFNKKDAWPRMMGLKIIAIILWGWEWLKKF